MSDRNGARGRGTYTVWRLGVKRKWFPLRMRIPVSSNSASAFFTLGILRGPGGEFIQSPMERTWRMELDESGKGKRRRIDTPIVYLLKRYVWSVSAEGICVERCEGSCATEENEWLRVGGEVWDALDL